MTSITSVISANMDYVYFISGLSFVLMGLTALELRKRDESLPWLPFALFGLSHGLFKWLEMLAVDLGDSPALLVIRLTIMAISFVMLMEFGLRGINWPDLPVVRGTIYPAMAAFLTLGFLSGESAEANAGCRYGFALTTGIITSTALWKAARDRERRQRRWLHVTAISMLLYSLVAGLVVPKSPFLLATWLNDEMFLTTLGLPVQVVSMLCALAAMVGLWLYNLARANEHERWGRIQKWLAPVSLGTLVMLGWFVAERRNQSLNAELRDHIAEEAHGLARTIDPELASGLTFTADDKVNPSFQRLRKQMIAYGEFIGRRSIYSLALRDGAIYFGPENLDEGDSLASPPGTVYRQAPEVIQEAFRSGVSFTHGPYTDEYGTFVTAYSPVCDPRTGQVIMLVAVDIMANDWLIASRPDRLLPIVCTLLIIFFIVSSLDAIQWRRRQAIDVQTRFRHIETAIVGGIGLALTVAISLMILEGERAERHMTFDRRASFRVETMRDELVSFRNHLSILAGFAVGYEDLYQTGIHAIASTMQKGALVEGYGWIPAVSSGQKGDFEAAVRWESGDNFAIWELDRNGRRVPVSDRDTYYPVYHVEPRRENEAALGYDLGSETCRRAALTEATQTGLPTATDAVVLVKDTTDQKSTLALSPVFVIDSSQGERHRTIRGFALAFIHFQSLFVGEGHTSETSENVMTLRLIDLTSKAGPEEIAVYPPDAARVDVLEVHGAAPSPDSLCRVDPIFAFGHAYAVLSHPTPGFYAQYPTRIAWLAGIVGIMLTILVVILTGHLCNARARLIRHVNERTVSLEQSEGRFSAIINAARDAIVVMDPQGKISLWSPGAEAMFGWGVDEAIGKPLHPLIVPSRYHEAHAQSYPNFLESGEGGAIGKTLELMALHKEGREFAVELSLSALDVHGQWGAVGMLRNIAERKQAEEKLRILADIVDSAPTSITIHDHDGKFLFANQRTYDLHGFSKEEFTAMNLRELDTPESSRMIASRIHDLMETGETSFEAAHYRKDRTVVPLHITAKNTVWNGRQVILSIASDITELAQAKAAIEKSHSLLNALINSVSDFAIFSLDREYRYTAFNEIHRLQMHKVWKAEIALGTSPLDQITSPEVRQETKQKIDLALSGEWFTEIQHQHGEAIFYEFFWSPIRNAAGDVIGITALIRDITDRYQAESEIRKLATAVTQTDEGVLITDTSGVIEYVNPGFEKLTLYNSEEVIGKTPKVLSSGKQDRSFYEDMWATLMSGNTWRGEFVNRKRDGSSYTQETTISPVLDASGKCTQYVALMRDISEKIALKQMLTQSQKMEAVGRLAGGVAHDFNNLLTVISGYAAILSKKLSDNPRQKEHAEEIAKAAARASSLTRQLLAFSRQQVAARTAVNLTALTSEMTNMLKRLIGDDIDLTCSTTDNNALIDADSSQIEQVVMNLVVNARDAMPEGGTLTIEVSSTEFTSDFVTSRFTLKPGQYVVLAVADTGSGMTEDTLTHLFEPFFTTKELGKGTGLGLATVYGIVSECNGAIEVASQIGVGTTFKAYFPRSSEAQLPPKEEPQVTIMSANGETILLVEDDLFMRSVVSRMITQLGYRVIACETGREALVHAGHSTAPIRMLLSDLVMPEMGGGEVADQIKKLLPSVEVLFMSGNPERKISDAQLLNLNAGFIKKPFNKAILSQKIGELLQRSARRTDAPC